MVEMDAGNTTPEFFISRFSGGAHCCAEVQILDVVGGQWRIVDGGRWDGDEIIPEDTDGDGEQEIVHGDDRFLYRYSCYACAAPPLRVFKLVEGTLADVTASPLYRSLDEKGLAEFPARLRQSRQWRLRLLCRRRVAPGTPRRSLEIHAGSLRPQKRLGIEGLRPDGRQRGNCLAEIQYKSYPDALDGFPAAYRLRRSPARLRFFGLPELRG